MKKLYAYQYAGMLFVMPLVAVFALRKGVSWGEWLMLAPLGVGAAVLLRAFFKDGDVASACAVFGRLKKPSAALFGIAFAASSGAVLSLSAKYAAETIFMAYPAWVVALPIAAACAFGALMGTSALGRAGFVIAAVGAAVVGGLAVLLMFFGKSANAPFEITLGGGTAAAIFLADGICAAPMMRHALGKRGWVYTLAQTGGIILGGVFIWAVSSVSESNVPIENAGALVRLGTLITPLTQLAAFFIAVYRISVGISVSADAFSMQEKRAVAFAAALTAIFAAVFIFTDAPLLYAAVYGVPLLLAGVGMILAKGKGRTA